MISLFVAAGKQAMDPIIPWYVHADPGWAGDPRIRTEVKGDSFIEGSWADHTRQISVTAAVGPLEAYLHGPGRGGIIPLRDLMNVFCPLEAEPQATQKT